MSQATKKMRSFACAVRDTGTFTTFENVQYLRDLTADAIEAVEARVAKVEAVAHAPQKVLAPSALDGVLARVSALESRCREDDRRIRTLEAKFVTTTDKAEPAPTAVQAPRGFRVGDLCRTSNTPSWETWRINDIDDDGRIYFASWTRTYRGAGWSPKDVTLVHAADAPADPDPALVERLAEAIRNSTPGKPGTATSYLVPSITAILSALTAEGRLCAPGEVEKLRAELASERASALLKRKHAETLTAQVNAAETVIDAERAECADLRAKLAAAEQARDDCTGVRDRLVRELLGERVERDHWKTRAEKAEGFLATESDAHKATRAKLAEAEFDRDAAFSKETALRIDVRAWQDAATEARGERNDLTRKLAEARQAHAELLKARMECASRADGYVAERDALRAEIDALRLAARTWFNAAGEPEILATAEEVTERRKKAALELAALKAKPRFRTRKVTKADVQEFWRDDGSALSTFEKMGFRRRVEPRS